MIRRLSWLVIIGLVTAGGVGAWINAYLNAPLQLTSNKYMLDVTKGTSLTSRL